MPTIVFNSSSGRNFSKKRKRMPGTDMTLKPEMKVYDGFNVASEADVFSERIWTNLAYSAEKPTNYSYSWNPYTISPPQNGTGVNQKIGKNYVLRYLKFKGYITLYKKCPMPINWRLVLYRQTDETISLLTRIGYLTYFNQKITTTPDSAAGWKAWSRNNYYMKVLRSDVKNEFRRKVIASGTLPGASTNYVFSSLGNWVDTEAGQTYNVNASFTGIGRINNYEGGEEALYVPVDVSVQVNDLIDRVVNFQNDTITINIRVN